MSLRIPQPATIEEARSIGVGAKVATYWKSDQTQQGQWYEATVVSVDDSLEPDPDRPEDVILPGVFYCLLAFQPQHGSGYEEADLAWGDVFDSANPELPAEILELPPGGLAAFPHFAPPRFMPPVGAARRSSQAVAAVPTPQKLKREAEAVGGAGGQQRQQQGQQQEPARKKARGSDPPAACGTQQGHAGSADEVIVLLSDSEEDAAQPPGGLSRSALPEDAAIVISDSDEEPGPSHRHQLKAAQREQQKREWEHWQRLREQQPKQEEPMQEPGQQTPTSQQRPGSQRAGGQRDHLAGRGGHGGHSGRGASQPSRGARAAAAAAAGGGMGTSDGGDGDFQPPSQRQGPGPGRPPVGGRGRGRGAGPRPPLPPPPDYSGVPDPADAPPAGKVKRIVMENFVCHTHTQLDLTPHVNLITGTNGSGKSGVLQALQLCLGAKPSVLGRYRAVHRYVKNHVGQAVLRVTLWNAGADAYRRAELGPEVTVVRRINATSGGSFEVLDHTGRVAFRGITEVHALVDALCINASNPAIVLTQDRARDFAGASSATDKYHGFMQATEFDKVLDYLLQSSERIHSMERLLDEEARAVKGMEGDLAAKQALSVQLQEVKVWQAHHDNLKKCLMWAPVLSIEQQIEERRDLRSGIPANQQALAAELANLRAQLAGVEGRLDAQQRELLEAEAAAEGGAQKLSGLRERVKRKREEVTGWQQQLAAQQQQLEELRGQRQALEEASREVTADFLRSTQEQVDGYKRRVGERRGACERASVAASGARQCINEREAALLLAKKEATEAGRAVGDGQRRLERAQRDLQRLQSATEAPLARFGGPGTVELDAAVKAAVAAGRFRQPPILIGAQLSLSDDCWATAVEAAMGRQLNTWICDTYEDAALLKSLRSKLRQPLQGFNTVVMPYRHPLHPISPHQLPPNGVVTCLRVLVVAEGPHSHVVKNVLIDHASIECTVLVSTREEAIRMTRDRQFWETYRLSNIYAKDGSRAYRRGSTETSLPPNNWLRPRLIKDLSQQVAQCRQEVAEAQEAVARLQQEAREKQERAIEALEELKEAKQRLQEAAQLKQTADSQYQEALSQQPLDLAAGGACAGGEGGEAAQQLAQLSSRIADAEVRLDADDDSLTAAEQQLSALLQEHQEARAEPQHIADTVAACQGAITRLGEDRQRLQAEVAERVEQEKELQLMGASFGEQLAECEAALAQALEAAEMVCSREEVTRVRERLIAEWQEQKLSEEAIGSLLDQEKMAARLDQLEKKISRRQADAQVEVEDLEIQVHSLELKLHKRRLLLEEATGKCDLCQEGHKLRRRKFKYLRTLVASALSKAFQRYMAYRQHQGSIDVSFSDKSLVFNVGIGKAAPTSDMKALSGGERSLASLAFILALGTVGVNPPFHALDEFDVYMDAINRRLALAFLLEFAWRNPDRQILLLTPQDISVVDEARKQVQREVKQDLPPGFIKVWRLPSPRERELAERANGGSAAAAGGGGQ